MKKDPDLDHFREMLTDAAAKGALGTVRFLLKRSPALAADIAAGNDCALGMAASKGHTDIVRFLHEHGAPVDGGDVTLAHNGFCLAAGNGHTDTVRYLLEHGADYAARDHDALWQAYLKGHHEIARMLLEAGSRLRIPIRRPPKNFRGPHGPSYSAEMQQVLTDFNLWFPEKRDGISALMNAIANWRKPEPPIVFPPPKTSTETLIQRLKNL